MNFFFLLVLSSTNVANGGILGGIIRSLATTGARNAMVRSGSTVAINGARSGLARSGSSVAVKTVSKVSGTGFKKAATNVGMNVGGGFIGGVAMEGAVMAIEKIRAEKSSNAVLVKTINSEFFLDQDCYNEGAYCFFKMLEKTEQKLHNVCCYMDDDGLVKIFYRGSSTDIIKLRTKAENGVKTFRCDVSCQNGRTLYLFLNQAKPNDISLIMNSIREAKTPEEREAMFQDIKKRPHLFNQFLQMTKRPNLCLK